MCNSGPFEFEATHFSLLLGDEKYEKDFLYETASFSVNKSSKVKATMQLVKRLSNKPP